MIANENTITPLNNFQYELKLSGSEFIITSDMVSYYTQVYICKQILIKFYQFLSIVYILGKILFYHIKNVYILIFSVNGIINIILHYLINVYAKI